jgi:hypothetical protein
MDMLENALSELKQNTSYLTGISTIIALPFLASRSARAANLAWG